MIQKLFKFFALGLLTITPVCLLAHGAGCSCSAHSGTVTAPHGGQIELTESSYFIEVLPEGDELKVFVMNHELESLPTHSVSLTGEIELPRQKRSNEPLAFKAANGYFQSHLSIPKRAHRYTVHLNIKHPEGSDSVSFLIEQ